MDDILVYGITFDEQLENLEAVSMIWKQKGIKLNVSKCHFFKQKVKYLGQMISKMGIRPTHMMLLHGILSKTTKICLRTSFNFGFPRILSRLCEKLYDYLKATL